MRWGMGAMLCPIKHYPTLRYFGVEVLRGILLQFWGPELRDRPTDTLTDGQAVLGAKTDLLEAHCGGESRWRNAKSQGGMPCKIIWFMLFCLILLVFSVLLWPLTFVAFVKTSMVVRAGVWERKKGSKRAREREWKSEESRREGERGGDQWTERTDKCERDVINGQTGQTNQIEKKISQTDRHHLN